MGDGNGKDRREPTAGRNGLQMAHVLFVVALLVAPAIALARMNLPVGPVWLVVTLVVVSLVAFLTQWIDKRRAESDAWRVPEKVLHLLELLGGWPGTFVAQRLFRHKTSKLSYQAVFWLIVAVHEFVAVDFLLGWKITLHARQLLGF